MQALLLVLACCFVQTQPSNLLLNAGFEEGGGWTTPGPVWSLDRSVHRSGLASLKYNNTAKNLYKMASQVVPVKPGARYRIGAWIRAQNVVGSEIGATIALEWIGTAGEFLGGCYPKGVTGTTDWTRVEAVSAVAPTAARSLRFVCYVANGSTGTAWFDDIDLVAMGRDDWHVTIVEPWFRGRLDGCSAVRIDVRLPLEAATKGHSVRASWAGLAGSGSTAKAAELTTLLLDASDLALGRHRLVVEWLDSQGNASRRYEREMTKGFLAPKSVGFDGVRLRIRGRPFFPLGVYDSEGWKPETTPERLQQMAKAGFNCVLPYGLLSGSVEDCRKYLDTAARLGLRVIVSLKDLCQHVRYPLRRMSGIEGRENVLRSVVLALQDHPALLAWYVNDESGPEHAEELRGLYETVIALDPEHPCLAVTNQPESAYEFWDSTDVIGVDPYPVPGSPLTLVRDWVQASGETGRPVWVAVQAFDKANYSPGPSFRSPTTAEYRAMAFLALASGATGLLAYSYHDVRREADFERRWAEMGAANRMLWRFGEVVSEGERLPIECEGAVAARWRLRGQEHLLLVNPTPSPVVASLPVSSARRCTEGFTRAVIQPQAGRLGRNLPAFGVEWLILDY
ncbi:MAG: hypothetical protein AMXMBFR61_12710 [Fimbriimonadales bacterium]